MLMVLNDEELIMKLGPLGELLAGWSGWSWWTGLALVAAVLAVWWGVPAPVGASSRLGLVGGTSTGRRWSGKLQWLLTGRSDAPPLRRRLPVGLAAGASLGALGWLRLDIGASALLVGAVTVLAAVLTLGWLEPGATRRRRAQLVVDTPQALDLMSACLASGLPLRSAAEAVVAVMDGPVAEDLHEVMAATRLGSGDVEAWLGLRSHPELGPAATDLARSCESGTMVVEALNEHARLAREKRRAAVQLRARVVGVRSVLPMMICFLPAFLLIGVVPAVGSAILGAFPR